MSKQSIDELVSDLAESLDEGSDIDNVLEATERLIKADDYPFDMSHLRKAFTEAYECSPEVYSRNLAEDKRLQDGKAPSAALDDIEPVVPATKKQLREF